MLQVAVLDISTQSVLFVTECVTNSSASVISLAVKTFSDTDVISSPENSESKTSKNLGQELVFVMTSNAHIIVMDSETGKMVSSWPMNPEKNSAAISMYIIGKYIQGSKTRFSTLPWSIMLRTLFMQTGAISSLMCPIKSIRWMHIQKVKIKVNLQRVICSLEVHHMKFNLKPQAKLCVLGCNWLAYSFYYVLKMHCSYTIWSPWLRCLLCIYWPF